MKNYDLYEWVGQFKRHGMTPTIRMQLRDLLTPQVRVRERVKWPEDLQENFDAESFDDLVDWELELTADHPHTVLRDDLLRDSKWESSLPQFLRDAESLLLNALDLKRELGAADDRSDGSYYAQPSISEHPQNRDFQDWTVLIDVTRDAWLATAKVSRRRAFAIAEEWMQFPYPLFKRLAFFAATHADIVPPATAYRWLTSDRGWWLWSVETQRETMRLLATLGNNLEEKALLRLEQKILAGPPRKMFRRGLSRLEWKDLASHSIRDHLRKLTAGGARLSPAAIPYLPAHEIGVPSREDDRDEFPVWMGDTFVGGVEPWKVFVALPRARRRLVQHLQQFPIAAPGTFDDWAQRCKDSVQATAYALWTLSEASVWPVSRWRDALHAWTGEPLLKASWNWVAPVLANAPADVISELGGSLSRWVQQNAKEFERHEDAFFGLVRRILDVEYEEDAVLDDPVSRAINHPVGHVTEALLFWWYRRPPKDDSGLLPPIRPLFTEICNRPILKFRHGRLLLATHVISLFRVDRIWTREFLLPLFQWDRDSTEVQAAWEGFLWSPRLYRPLLEAFKPAFLETARHYSRLKDHRSQYAALLTFAALDRGETFTVEELAAATRALPPDGLSETAQALCRAMEGASAQRDEYWRNRVKPYLQQIWPSDRDRMTPQISEAFARLCIAAGNSFVDAFDLLRFYLARLSHDDYVIHRLGEAKIASKYPEHVLRFLDMVTDVDSPWPPRELVQCLNDVASAAPQLTDDPRFRRLEDYLRRFSQR